jgi:peptidoglycan hydrolase CwlO-like protein
MKISPKQIITIAVILVIAVIGYYFWTTSKPGYVKKYQAQIDSAQVKIDSLNTELIKSDELIDSMNHELFILDEKTDSLKNTITNIKKQSHEKINAVDKLNNAELSEFFSNRYNIN